MSKIAPEPNIIEINSKKQAIMTKVAVIGTGAWGKNLVRTFSQLGVLATVCDSNAKALQNVSSQYPKVKVTQNIQDVLKDKEIQAIVVATPAVLHYSLAKQALEHNKHVFVEKPLSLKVKEGEELVALAKKQNRILMVGHILQYHNAVVKLKELIEQGELGQIQYIYSNRLNIGKIRSEENSLWSFAPHDISVILMFLNEFPESVYCSGGTYLQSNIADVTLTVMKFKSGVQAHFFVSWLHPFKEQKLIVVGTKKMAVFDDVASDKLVLYPHRVDWIDRIPVASKAEAEVVQITQEEPLRNECQHFLDCVAAHKTPKTDGKEGLNVLKILEMAQESLNSGKTISTQGISVAKGGFFVHDSSEVDADVTIGEGTQIWHFSHVLKNSTIGKNCKIGQNVVIGPNAVVGNGCKIQNNVSIYKGVTIEDDVFCGPSMVFTNVFNPRSAIPRMDELRTTLVKKGATLGANCTILCGLTVGRYAFVGAGAVVTKDVPDYALVYGNPAKIQGYMCECGEKLTVKQNKALCKSCSKRYSIKKKLIFPI